MSARADVRAVSADATPCAPTCRRRARGAHRESAALPTTDLPTPCLERGRGCLDRLEDGRLADVSTVGSIDGEASRDANARRYPGGQAPTPCASSATFGPRRSKIVGR